MGIAVVFPGQGSQTPGAGRPWMDRPSWSVVTEAEDVLQQPLAHLLTDPEADLSSTRASQLSVLLASLVAWRALTTERGEGTVLGRPVIAMAGHSLGQITALIAAGVVGFADGIRLAAARADATEAAQARRPGGLVALVGSTLEQAHAACAAVPGGAWVANVNGAGQVVCGGPTENLDALGEKALVVGARRVRPLAVDGAFHTPLMAAAVTALEPVLARTRFGVPRWPLITNHDGLAATTDQGWTEHLSRHLVEPVRWDLVVDRLICLGADTIVEVGPGRTLTGLIRRIAPDLDLLDVSSPTDLMTGAR